MTANRGGTLGGRRPSTDALDRLFGSRRLPRQRLFGCARLVGGPRRRAARLVGRERRDIGRLVVDVLALHDRWPRSARRRHRRIRHLLAARRGRCAGRIARRQAREGDGDHADDDGRGRQARQPSAGVPAARAAELRRALPIERVSGGAPRPRRDVDLGELAKALPGGLGQSHVLAARLALGEVALDRLEPVVRQGSIHVGGEELLGVAAGVGHSGSHRIRPLDGRSPRSGSPTPRARASATRPRWSLDFTVPTGTPRMSATS